MPAPSLTGFLRRLAVADDSDAALVRAFVESRSEIAFTELVRRYGPRVYAICRRTLRDHHLAEDAFQAVFVVLARKAHMILPPAAVGGWLSGVAWRAAAEAAAMRRRKYREALPGALPDRPVDGLEPDDSAAIVHAEIANLPDTLRSAALLCEIDGLSRATAAERLGVTPGTLSSRLAAARKLLRERLRRRGLAPLLAVAGVAVPDALAKAASTRVNGQATGAVLELTQGVLRTMMLTNWKLMPLMLLGGVLGASVAFGVVPESRKTGEAAVGVPVVEPLKSRVMAPMPPLPAWSEVFTLKQSSAVTAVAASADLIAVTVKDAVTDDDRRLRLWSARDGKPSGLEIRGPRFTIPADSLRFAANDRYLVMSTPNTDRGGGCVNRYEQRRGGMVADGSGIGLSSWSSDLSVCLVREPAEPSRLFIHGDLWNGGDNLIKPLATLEVPGSVAITHAVLSADSRRLAVASEDGVIRLHHCATLRELHKVTVPKGVKLKAMRLSDDGKQLAAVGEPGFARVYDADTGRELWELKGHLGPVNVVEFSRDSKRVSTANGKIVRIYDARTGKKTGEITGHSGEVTAIAFTPDGKRVVTGSADQTAKVWECRE